MSGRLLPLEIRDMKPEDIPALLPVERASFSSPWTSEVFEYQLGRVSTALFLVADSPVGLIGYIGAQIFENEVHLMKIAVKPELRRLSYGASLMIECIRRAVARGACWLSLEVRSGNDTAKPFYLMFGLRPLAVHKGYYSDQHEDAIVMAVSGINGPGYLELLETIEGRFSSREVGD